jgi:hypothetical protein
MIIAAQWNFVAGSLILTATAAHGEIQLAVALEIAGSGPMS